MKTEKNEKINPPTYNQVTNPINTCEVYINPAYNPDIYNPSLPENVNAPNQITQNPTKSPNISQNPSSSFSLSQYPDEPYSKPNQYGPQPAYQYNPPHGVYPTGPMSPGQYLRPTGLHKGPDGQYKGPPGQYMGPSDQAASYNAYTNQVVVVSSANYHGMRNTNFHNAIVLACWTTLCYGFIFGFIAIILALIGKKKMRSGEHLVAKRLYCASIALSIIGPILSTTLITILVPVYIIYIRYR